MVGWYHQLDGYEFEQAPGDGEGQSCTIKKTKHQRIGVFELQCWKDSENLPFKKAL